MNSKYLYVFICLWLILSCVLFEQAESWLARRERRRSRRTRRRKGKKCRNRRYCNFPDVNERSDEVSLVRVCTDLCLKKIGKNVPAAFGQLCDLCRTFDNEVKKLCYLLVVSEGKAAHEFQIMLSRIFPLYFTCIHTRNYAVICQAKATIDVDQTQR